MSFRGDDRGAAVQVGAVILFGFLVIAVATWQATVVPQENARVEYTHSQRAVDDMQDARNVVVSAPGEGSLRSVGVEMAPSYPPRSIFVNPGPPSGTLRTVGTGDPGLAVTVNNATATDDEAADFWNGTPHARYPTGGLEYEAGYNVYTGAPDTVYENSVLYNVGNDGTVVNVTGQDLVDGRTLTLVTLDGNLSRTTAGTYTVDFEALSTSSTSVAVTNASDGNVTVSFPSRRGAGWWNATLAESGELDEFGGHVVDVRATSLGTYNNVTIELEGDVTYELRMAKVGVGAGADDPGKSYVVDVAGDGTSVQSGNTRQLTVEVRDRYSNPVSGVTVEVDDAATDLDGGSLDTTEATTGSDGRATFEYTGGSAGTATVVVNVSDDATPLSRELATFDVAVTGSGTGTTSNGAYSIDWQDPDDDNPSDPLSSCTASDCTWDVGADGDGSLALRALTDPTVQDLGTEFAVNDSAVATLSGSDATTGSDGEATTTLDAVANGTVKVFAITGGASDVINVTVTNVSAGGSPAQVGVVYADANQYVRSVDRSGGVIPFDSKGSAEAMSPGTVDFDGDGDVEVAYVNGSAGITLVDRNNGTQSVLSSGAEKTALAVGTWQGSAESVFYANSSDGDLYRKAPGRSAVQVAAFGGKSVISVGGVADLDGDGSDEIAVALSNGKLGLVDDDGTTLEPNVQVGSNNNWGIGTPADFDGDGAVRVPVVDDSNNLNLAACSIQSTGGGKSASCTETTVVNGGAAKTAVGAYDYDGDGVADLAYADTTFELAYYDPVDGSSGAVTDADGNTVGVYGAGGVR